MIIGAFPTGWALALWLAWIVLLILLFVHIVLRRDIRWGRKVIWMIVILLLPFVGSVVYVLVWAFKRMNRQPVPDD
ncbi:MAG TPA: PLDc N-terminal domain-containing protein [Gaiellaceae bacterium]|nr:PLDc N-terminal domain-containing protein [Gaiellaceae bacterium]